MTDPRITRIAAEARPISKNSARAALKAAGLRQTLAQDLLSEVDRIMTRRAEKARARYALTRAPIKRLRPVVLLPQGTPATRLTAARHAAILATLGRLIDRHAHGAWSVVLTTDPAAVGIRYSQYYTGEKAGKWNIQATDTVITVPADWRVRVQRRGLDIVDGLMTLDAAPLEAQGCELFAATWARRTGAKNVAIDRDVLGARPPCPCGGK